MNMLMVELWFKRLAIELDIDCVMNG